jgi:YbbR domain-containing protein
MRLAGRLLDHWELKLLALFFAVVLWIFVAAEDQGDKVFTVPLDVRDVPPGMEATLETETVEVRVHGFRHLLDRMDEQRLRAQVSLRDAAPGEVIVRIPTDAVSLPRGLAVLRINPPRIRATIEPTLTRSPRPSGG